MGPGSRIRRAWNIALVVAVAAAGGGAAFAVASVPGSDGVIHACVITAAAGTPVTTGPNLRVIDPSAGQTCDTTANPAGTPATEENLFWNQRGLRGATGEQGAAGRSITVAGGNTLTIAGRVVTVGPSAGLTINPPPTRGKPVGTLTLDLGGRSPMSFEILSFSFGAHQTGAHGGGGGGGGGAGKVNEIVITKSLDKADTKLALFCANGKHIPKATITVRKAGKHPQVYLVITMENTLISSYQVSGHGSGGENPTESVSLNFTKLALKYK